jgi:hypothetical protein
VGILQGTWRHGPTAQLVGVLDGAWLLLYPEQTYQFIVGMAKAAGRMFPVEQTTLVKRLDEDGLIATEIEGGERRRKVKAWIHGASKRVLKLRRDALTATPAVTEFRGEREGRGEPAPSGTNETVMPSWPALNGMDIGQLQMLDTYVVEPTLPGLPDLLGSDRGERANGAVAEVTESTAPL